MMTVDFIVARTGIWGCAVVRRRTEGAVETEEAADGEFVHVNWHHGENYCDNQVCPCWFYCINEVVSLSSL